MKSAIDDESIKLTNYKIIMLLWGSIKNILFIDMAGYMQKKHLQYFKEE
jgi:hypothetical protein